MSVFASWFGGTSKRKQQAQALFDNARVADQQAAQLAQVQAQTAEQDRVLGRSRRAARGRRLLRYASGAAGNRGL
jgi:hypothetical protein